MDGYCNGSDKPKDEAMEEAKAYLKVIEDASNYAFNLSHAVAYCMIGYLFAYMRYYHPEAFICAYLNCANNESDIVSGTNLARSMKIRIEEPKFRHASDEYSFDANEHVVYKGIGSIKYMNASTASELHVLSNTQYDNFFLFLKDIKELTNVNRRQLEVLIKLDFFKEFNNAKKLLRYVEYFDLLGEYKKSSISYDKVHSGVFESIVKAHSKEQAKGYKYIDRDAIFKEVHDALDALNVKDFTIKEKILTQMEFLGYVAISTKKPEDRQKLLITKVVPLMARKGKKAGQIWCRIVQTHSIGSGVDGEWQILEDDYQKQFQFKESDIIYLQKWRSDYYNEKKQWWMQRYDPVLE